MNEKLKEDDLVLCTVRRIEGTTVFVDIEGNGEGSIMFSEVSPGRIRNIREFVTEGKKIVCKVLRVQSNRLELTLRRVTTKERENVLERHKKERTLIAIIQPILKESTQKIIEEIRAEYELADFLDAVREDPKLIDKFTSKADSEKLAKIFAEKREKEKEVKKTISLKSIAPAGLYELQKVLETDKADVTYLGSSKFLARVHDKDFKHANIKLNSFLKEVEERAKALKMNIEIK